ncbi:MAG: ParB/RepB/Spo0J family partition protein [Vitreimonas sp.]
MSHQLIPLNQLVPSDANVRRTDRKADLDALIASIKAHGLLQNLSVQKRDDTHFEVVAGGRRLTALKALAKQGHIARDFPVPCNLIDTSNAGEASLAENVQRVAMNAMDEADAFHALAEDNFTADAIAQRFGVTSRHVEQRLALAALSAKVKAAYRRGDLNLEAVRAFCIEPDHARQDAALKVLGKPVTHAGDVRALLTEGAMKASDRVARFVGLEAYEAASGVLTRDLFESDIVVIAYPDLMTRLATEKLEALQADYLTQGWGWVETGLAQTQSLPGGRRIHPRHRAPTRTEKKKLRELDAAIDALDDALDTSEAENDDARIAQREEFDAERDRLMEALIEWNKEEISRAGVVIGVDYSGRPSITCGVVRKADEAALKRIVSTRNSASGAEPAGDDTDDSTMASRSPRQFPKDVTRDLTNARAIALRATLISHPDLGLALTVYALASTWHGARATGIGITFSPVEPAGENDIERARLSVMAELPEDARDLLRWSLAQPRERLLNILAVGAASALDLVHEANSAADDAKQNLGDALATHIGLNMCQHWRVDLSVLSRMSKHALIEAIEGSAAITKLSEGRRTKQLQSHAKLKRDDLAKVAARMLKGSAWLPEVLITPTPHGALALTDQGEAAAAAIAAE